MNAWYKGTHVRVLSESYPINTNMTGLRWLSKNVRTFALDESGLSIGRVKRNDTVRLILPMLRLLSL